MSSEEFDLESEVNAIVIDAFASMAGLEHQNVESATPLDGLDSLERQELVIEIEEQCEQLRPFAKLDTPFHLPDKDIPDARTTGDLIAITLHAIEAVLHGESRNAHA